MEKVAGIGGFFFRSRNPESLADWYARHLGVDPPSAVYEADSWQQTAGTTVFSPFPSDSTYFAADRGWMINFRVDDLDAITAQLRNAAVDVEVHEEFYANGRFAHLSDPEGNPIELWEPFHRDAGAEPDERLDVFFRLFARIAAARTDGHWSRVDELFTGDASVHLDSRTARAGDRWAPLSALRSRPKVVARPSIQDGDVTSEVALDDARAIATITVTDGLIASFVLETIVA